jgi:esterase
MLNFHTFGEESAKPTLLIVHGLFGSARNWRAIARHFSKTRRVITVDMRNHGDSFWHDDNSYHDMADDLAAVIKHHGRKMDVLGHSMGGKASMVLALENPELVHHLIVADIAPVTYTHDQVSNVKIMQSMPLNTIESRSEADKILAHDIEEPAVRAFFLQSLILSDDGNSWQLNLDALEQNMDSIVGFPKISGQYDGGTLIIRGGASPYVTSAGLDVVAKHFPHYHMQTIPEAGHWLHAEKPREFIATVAGFID